MGWGCAFFVACDGCACGHEIFEAIVGVVSLLLVFVGRSEKRLRSIEEHGEEWTGEVWAVGSCQLSVGSWEVRRVQFDVW